MLDVQFVSKRNMGEAAQRSHMNGLKHKQLVQQRKPSILREEPIQLVLSPVLQLLQTCKHIRFS